MVLESNSRKQLTQIRAEEWMVPGGSHLGKDLSLRIYGEWGMEKGCWGRGSSEDGVEGRGFVYLLLQRHQNCDKTMEQRASRVTWGSEGL